MNEVDCIGIKTLADAAACLADLLAQPLLAGKSVVWLVSGGSSLPIASAAASRLADINCARLRVGLVDDVAASDQSKATNYEQLNALGFAMAGVEVYRLVKPGLAPADCAATYAAQLEAWFSEADYALGQFGIGEGYHTGGIQPGSPAASEQSALAISYDDKGVTRVTITPECIKRLDVAFINSFGESKRPLIEHFLASEADIATEPTQALKTAGETRLYSDYGSA